MVKCSMIGLSSSFKFVSRLSDEFVRDYILSFLLVFSFFVVGEDESTFLGEFWGFDDDESDIGLLCVSFGVQGSASSRWFWVGWIPLVSSAFSVQLKKVWSGCISSNALVGERIFSIDSVWSSVVGTSLFDLFVMGKGLLSDIFSTLFLQLLFVVWPVALHMCK